MQAGAEAHSAKDWVDLREESSTDQHWGQELPLEAHPCQSSTGSDTEFLQQTSGQSEEFQSSCPGHRTPREHGC